MSNGMLASPKELAISDNHEGILEIDEDIAPGTSFVDAFDLRDDFVLDIENKMFTHRPDCFGWLGVAREVAGIQGKAFTSPEWYDETALEGTATTKEDTLPLVLTNEISELVPRFIAITLQNITVGSSPLWLQLRLARHGVRPINNVVDITNYLMLETGQPLHAYDYDKVRAQDANAKHATIGARYPNQNETLALLNGKTVTPHETAIIISSVDRAIGLGGVMGGADSEVTENTTNIILECASFDMYAIRRTAMEHGIFTDAVTRFTKGQSPLQNGAVAKRAVTMLEALAGAQVVRVYADNHVAHTTSSL
jgi:phenylalanyl-tRNA synthetase beta chain